MGTQARAIVEKAGLNADELINLLNKAFCDEWLAYYQYWIGARVVEGIPRAGLQPELEEQNESLTASKKELEGEISESMRLLAEYIKTEG